jgi:myo-inositol 2-dehydrogenase/D-chiro-inositol 1-dehydrogenase
MSRIKIGIIGAGYIGGVHAQALLRDERVHLSAVYDLREEAAQALARSSGATVAGSAEELMEASDCVYITTPNTKHTELALAAAVMDKHVFCEKPLATNLSDARKVMDAAEMSDAVFQVGHNRRFAPVYVALKEMLARDAAPHSAHVKMNRGELINPEWVGDPQVTGGFLYETTIHMFDMMRFLFGEVKELIALGSTHEYPETDDFSVLLGFANGVHATLCSSADASWLFPFERVEVFCHHRTLATREMETLVSSEGMEGRQTTLSLHQLSKEEKWGYLQEDRAFVDAISNKTPALVSALDGYKSVELVDACYRAVRTGERISF